MSTIYFGRKVRFLRKFGSGSCPKKRVRIRAFSKYGFDKTLVSASLPQSQNNHNSETETLAVFVLYTAFYSLKFFKIINSL